MRLHPEIPTSLLAFLLAACQPNLAVAPDPQRPTPVGAQNRRVFEYAGYVDAPAEEVFPLLCPVQEYLWLEGWNAKMIHSVSGVAELGAVFSTKIRTGETWVVTRYDPPTAIGFTIFSGPAVLALDLRVEPDGPNGSRVFWSRTYTPTTRLGRRVVQRLDAAEETDDMASVHAQLAEYMEQR